MSKLIGIPSTMLPEAWPEVEPFLSSIASQSGGKFKTADFARAIGAREMQLWAAVENSGPVAVGLTELLNYPQQRVCRFISANGRDAKSWAGHIESVERWAAIAGAVNMEILAPTGWERLLRDYHYKRTHVLLEKPIGEG